MLRWGGEQRGSLMNDIAQTRRREIAAEHLLFKTMEYVETRYPGLLDFLEGSLDHLGDPAIGADKDDDAVREIARRMIAGARRQGVD
jgi:hypothetical protein